MCMSSPKMPSTPSAPAAPPPAPTQADAAVQDAATNEVQKEKMAKGRSSTILTGPLGLKTDATLQKKTLLGQ